MATGYTIDSSAANNTITVDGSDLNFVNTTTSTDFIWNQGGEITVESFEFKTTEDGNFIEVVKRQKPNPNVYVGTWPMQEPVDTVWKEVYGIMRDENGKKQLQLIRRIDAKVTPGHYVDEKIEFDD